MRLVEIQNRTGENKEVITEGAVRDFIDTLKDMSSDFWYVFKEDGVFRTLVIGGAIMLGALGVASYEGWKEAEYFKKVDTELYEMYEQYSGTNKYLDFDQEFEKYLALKSIASQTKTEHYSYYNAATKSMRTGTKTVPKYPEKVVELAAFTKMLVEKYNIVAEK